MNLPAYSFDSIIDTIYNLTLEEKEEIKNLLEHNIADTRRDQIAKNAQRSKQEEESGTLTFSSNISDLKKML